MMEQFFFHSLSRFAGAQRQRKGVVHLHPWFPLLASVDTQHRHNPGDTYSRVYKTSFGCTSFLMLDHPLSGGEN